MRKTIIIFKWEIKRIVTNWRKALAMFLMPAVLMMVVLNLIPVLINYVTTGSFGQKPIIAVNAPDSFIDYVESDDYAFSRKFVFEDEDDVYSSDITRLVKKGNMVIKFSDKFDHEIKDFYRELYKGNSTPSSKASIEIIFNDSSIAMYQRASQFEQEDLVQYREYCFDALAGKYKKIGWDRFETDDFNPITAIVKNRGTANQQAAIIIPGIIILLLYYCVYSLSCDIFAAERDRGFMKKLILTPLSPSSIFGGKAAAVTAIAFLSSIVTYAVLSLASWMNIRNDSMSLIPFGMILTFKEFIAFLLVIPPAAFVLSAVCISIVFSLEKMQDILMNLQFPLIIFLLEFFLQMARSAPPFALEFMIPVHGTLCAMRDIFATDVRWYLLILTSLMNILVGTLIMYRTFKKIGDGSYDA